MIVMIYRPLKDLTKLSGNPRTISKDDMLRLTTSIENNPDYFEARPLILSNRTGKLVILGGNQRYEAARKLKYKNVPTHLIEGLTEEREQEIVIRDNVANGEWDTDILANEWTNLPLSDWGLELPGLETVTEVDEDEAPELSSAPPVSELGKVYQLGKHRVMCGDSTDKDQVETLMAGVKADMVFTDPPYGMDYSGRGKKTSKKILGDTMDTAEFYNLGHDIAERYIWGRVENYVQLRDKPRDVIIWKKNNFGMGSGYRGQYECCFYYGRFSGSDSDVWEVPKDSNYEHPTQKPVALAARAIKNSQPAIVIDYFAGSGSTLIACEQTDRICYGMELDPQYVDVIRKRYATFISSNKTLPDNWQDITPELDG